MENRAPDTRWLGVFVVASVWFLGPARSMGQPLADHPLHWSTPTTLPPGALVAVVSGDPRGPGESTLLVSMPNRYRIGPHSHPSYERVEVREGKLLVGMGDTLDRKLARPLVAGDSVTFLPGMHHYWIASGRTIVSITFMGPFTITYLRAEDAPRPRNFPFGY